MKIIKKIEKIYGKDSGVDNNEKLNKYLKKNGHRTLAKLINKL